MCEHCEAIDQLSAALREMSEDLHLTSRAVLEDSRLSLAEQTSYAGALAGASILINILFEGTSGQELRTLQAGITSVFKLNEGNGMPHSATVQFAQELLEMLRDRKLPNGPLIQTRPQPQQYSHEVLTELLSEIFGIRPSTARQHSYSPPWPQQAARSSSAHEDNPSREHTMQNDPQGSPRPDPLTGRVYNQPRGDQYTPPSEVRPEPALTMPGADEEPPTTPQQADEGEAEPQSER